MVDISGLAACIYLCVVSSTLDALLDLVVVVGAQGLPIEPRPEQARVAFVGYDVVDHSGWREGTFFLAHAAERVPDEVALTLTIPSGIVATLAATALHRVECFTWNNLP
jgi:hypothetical protein